VATSLGLSNRWPLPTKLSRIYSILFLFALLALTACTSNDPPTVATTQPATTNEPTATTATEPGATGPTAAAVIEPTPQHRSNTHVHPILSASANAYHHLGSVRTQSTPGD
jgi:hypothetical protein